MKKTRLLIIILIVLIGGAGFVGYNFVQQKQKIKAEERKGQLASLE